MKDKLTPEEAFQYTIDIMSVLNAIHKEKKPSKHHLRQLCSLAEKLALISDKRGLQEHIKEDLEKFRLELNKI